MNDKKIGLILLVLTIILSISFGLLWNELSNEIRSNAVIGPGGQCIHDKGTECPFERLNELNPLLYLGVLAISLLFIFSIYLMTRKSIIVKKEIKSKDLRLNSEEKKVYDVVKDSEGSIFQSELVEKTGFTKVKIKRILDKLEGKRVIERKRRGMTNVVILKD